MTVKKIHYESKSEMLPKPTAPVLTGSGDDPLDPNDVGEYNAARYFSIIVNLITGVPLLLFGLAHWNKVGIISGIAFGSTLIIFIQNIYMHDKEYDLRLTALWVGAGISCSYGWAFLFWWQPRLASSLLGVQWGFSLGEITMELIKVIGYDVHIPNWFFVTAYLVLVLGGIVIGCLTPVHFILLGTASAGAYNLTSGIGLIWKQFPYYNEGKQDPNVWWLYFCLNILLFVVGASIQYRAMWLANKKHVKEYGFKNTYAALENV